MIELVVLSLSAFVGTIAANFLVYKVSERAVRKQLKSKQAKEAGEISGQVRAEKGLVRRVVTDIVDQNNPVLGYVLNQFPSARDYLAEHPNALPKLLEMFAPLLKNLKLGSGGTSGKSGYEGELRYG